MEEDTFSTEIFATSSPFLLRSCPLVAAVRVDANI